MNYLQALFSKIRLDVSLLVLAITSLILSGKSSVLLFLVILLVLVLVHEFGHFIVAKWTGMRVDEFAFGFPPKLISFKKGETTYSINIVPLGGYVAIFGENGEPNDIAKHDTRAFSNRPWWAQLLTLLAGVTMNLLLAWVILIGLSYGTVQVSTRDATYGSRVTNPMLAVLDAVPESPAYKAGIIPGSYITAMTSNGSVASLTSASSAASFIEHHQNDAITISFTNPEGARSSTTIAAVYGIIPDRKATGLLLDVVGEIRTSPYEAVVMGTEQTYIITKETVKGFTALVGSAFQGENVLSSLSGPVGIAKMVGERSSYGVESLFTLVAVLSISLAVLNSVPFPALDGGRIIVVLFETISRRRVPMKWLMYGNAAGFIALITLLVVVTIKDIFY